MPETIATAIATAFPATAATIAGTTITYASIIGYTTFIIASAAYSRAQERDARRSANESLQDRLVQATGSDSARTIVYGRTRVAGHIGYHVNYGSRRESVSTLHDMAGHEITSYDDVWLNDATIGTLPSDPGGEVATDSPWYSVYPDPRTMTFTGPAASGTQALDLDGSPFIALDTLVYRSPILAAAASLNEGVAESGADVLLVAGTDYTLSGSTITFTGSAQEGNPVTATYRINRGHAGVAVYYFLGDSAGEQDTLLESVSGGEWTSSAIGANIARLHVVTTWEETLFSAGFPSVTAIVKGKKVYDPREDSTNGGSGSQRANTQSTWTYSDNPALCAADYLRSALGFGCASTEIDWTAVASAANICDELVNIDIVPNQQKRYVCAGVLSTESDRKSNIEAILNSMQGIAFWSGGVWVIRAGAYATPSLDLDQDDLAGGDITISQPALKDRFNAVRGRYRAPDQKYQVTDYPPYESSTYLADDNDTVYTYREIDLAMVDDPLRAQRIAKLILHRARQGLLVSATFKLSAYSVQPGDNIRLTISRYGWSNKVFRVLDREFINLNAVKLTLQEDASAVYSWTYSEATEPDPSPNTSLPDPRAVDVLTGISAVTDDTTFYLSADGVVVPYVEVTWDLPDAEDVHVEVFWKRAGDLEYQRIVRPRGVTLAWLQGVSPGETLNIYLVAVNAIGAKSAIAWIPSYTVSATSQSGRVVNTANRLKNATFDANTGGWSTADVGITSGTAELLKPTLLNGYPNGIIPGTPTNALLRIPSSLTGDGYAGVITSDPVSVTPGQRYVAYVGAIAWASDAFMQLEWIDIAGNSLGSVQSETLSGVPVDTLSAQWWRVEHYTTLVAIGTAPDGARSARMLVYAMGNWLAGAWKYLSIYRAFCGEFPSGLTQLPPWSAGGVNSVGDGMVAVGAVTQIVEFVDPVGMTINNEGAIWSDYTMTTATVESDGVMHISVTFQVDAAAIGGASTISAGIMETAKLPLVSRNVFTVASGSTNSTTMTLTADMTVSAGDIVAPLLRLTRSRFGVGVGSTTDRVSLISGRLKLHKA